MKKIYSLLMVVIMAVGAFTLTSCDEDQLTGMQLQGSWQGQTLSSNGNRSTTTFMFTNDPFRNTKGTGYWLDFYSRVTYVADKIDWQVKDGVIYIYSIRDRFTYTIRDYRIKNDHFVGYISDGQNESYFDMIKIDDSWINDYDWSTGYYSKQNVFAEPEQ